MALFDKKEKKPELPVPPAYNPNMMSSPAMPAPTPNNFPNMNMTENNSNIPTNPFDKLPKMEMNNNLAPLPSENKLNNKDHTELMTEDIEKITESIISEKWGKLSSELKNMMEWKNELSKQLDSYKKKVEDLYNKLAQTQTAMIGKVDEYNKSIGDVNVEIQAMGKVFEKLIPEFTNNVKELSEIVKKHK